MTTAEFCGLTFEIRDGTTDWNTINACCAEDEYGLRDEPVDGALVFDIGAHVGGVGVWLASRGARVVFVEPVPSNAEQIRRHLANNHLNGYVIEAALGTAYVNLGPEGDAHEFIANIGGVNDERRIDCAQVSLADLVGEYGYPDILKLDCEGGEWAVFNDPAVQAIPLIVGEYHDDRVTGGEYTAPDIARLLPNHDVTVGENDIFGPFTARLRT